MRFTELLNFHIDTFGKTLSWPFFKVEDYYGLIFELCKKLLDASLNCQWRVVLEKTAVVVA